jgi:hypothetical protein
MLVTYHLQEYLPEQNENIKRTQEKQAKSENLRERQAYHLETSDAKLQMLIKQYRTRG